VCAALSNRNAFDLRAADGAWFSFPVIDSKMVLEFTAAIDPIDGRSIAADAFAQDLADRIMQSLSLFRRYRIGRGQWMQFRDMQGFIRVNVAQTCNECLIEQQRLELAMFGMQGGVEPVR
jgi:hypothetical protein